MAQVVPGRMSFTSPNQQSEDIRRVFLVSISLNYQKTLIGLGVTDTNLLNITVITT